MVSSGTVILGIAVAVVGTWMWRARARYRQLSRHVATLAHRLDATLDPPDRRGVEFRFGQSVLLTMGHDWRLSEMLHARRGEHPFWFFRVNLDMARGLVRQHRAYWAVWIEWSERDSHFLLWHDSDVAQAPLVVRESRTRCGSWWLRGDSVLAESIVTWLETMDNPPHCEFLAGAIWLYWPADGVPSEQLEKTFGALGEQVDSLVSHLSEEPAWGSEKKEMGSVL